MSRQSRNDKITAMYTRIDYPGNQNQILLQQKMLEQYANEKQLSNIVHYIDNGFTGQNRKRPSFEKMIADVKAGKVSIVLVSGLDRLSRNMWNVCFLLEVLFPQYGVVLYSLRENRTSEHSSYPHLKELEALLGGVR